MSDLVQIANQLAYTGYSVFACSISLACDLISSILGRLAALICPKRLNNGMDCIYCIEERNQRRRRSLATQNATQSDLTPIYDPFTYRQRSQLEEHSFYDEKSSEPSTDEATIESSTDEATTEPSTDEATIEPSTDKATIEPSTDKATSDMVRWCRELLGVTQHGDDIHLSLCDGRNEMIAFLENLKEQQFSMTGSRVITLLQRVNEKLTDADQRLFDAPCVSNCCPLSDVTTFTE